MLPRRIPKPAKRSSRWRSAAHMNFVRGHECCVPGCGGRPIEVAHIRTAANSGMGIKPNDAFTVSLCTEHHRESHLGDRTFQTKYAIDLMALAEAFYRASPHRMKLDNPYDQ